MDQKFFPSANEPDSSPRSLRVLIVDDHELIRLAIKALLQQEFPHIDVIGMAGDGATAIRLARDSVPDVVLLDLDLGNEYGLNLLPVLRGQFGPEIIILTASDDPLDRSRALAAGAFAFISKLSPANVLISAILDIGSTLRRPGCLSYGSGTQLPGK